MFKLKKQRANNPTEIVKIKDKIRDIHQVI